MRRWLMRQIRDSVGDTTFAAISFVVGLAILGYAIWEDWNLIQFFQWNLELISLLKYIPIVGKKIANGLALIGFDRTLFFFELWALVALILRVMWLGVQYLWRRAKFRLYNARLLQRRFRWKRNRTRI